MKQRSLTVGLIVATAVLALLLGGCNLANSASQTDLQNATGGDGPGSGNWKPVKPENQRQARQLYDVLQTLGQNTNEASTNYDNGYIKCLDGNGNLLSGQSEECIQQLSQSAKNVNNMLSDFFRGHDVFVSWVKQNGGVDIPQSVPFPKAPINPPATLDPGETNPSWTGCLTCTHSLDVEFVFSPAPVEIGQSTQ